MKQLTLKTATVRHDFGNKTTESILSHTIHILGHQDDDPTKQLDRWATLNCEMDSNAKEHFQRLQREKAGQEQENQMSIADEPWQFSIQGVKISCNAKE